MCNTTDLHLGTRTSDNQWIGGRMDNAAVLVFWRRQKSLVNAGIRTRDRAARSIVTIPTELSRHHKLLPVLNLSSLHRKFFWVLIFSFYLNPKIYRYGHTIFSKLRYDILSHIRRLLGRKVPSAHISCASSRLSICARAVTSCINWGATDPISWNLRYVYVCSLRYTCLRQLKGPPTVKYGL